MDVGVLSYGSRQADRLVISIGRSLERLLDIEDMSVHSESQTRLREAHLLPDGPGIVVRPGVYPAAVGVEQPNEPPDERPYVVIGAVAPVPKRHPKRIPLALGDRPALAVMAIQGQIDVIDLDRHGVDAVLPGKPEIPHGVTAREVAGGKNKQKFPQHEFVLLVPGRIPSPPPHHPGMVARMRPMVAGPPHGGQTQDDYRQDHRGAENVKILGHLTPPKSRVARGICPFRQTARLSPIDFFRNKTERAY